MNNNKLTLRWIKGHDSSRGNINADKLARKAARNVLIGPEPSASLAKATIKENIRQCTLEKFKSMWDDTTNCQLSREILHYPCERTAKEYLKLSRKNLRWVTGILTGHTKVYGHLHRIGLHDSPNCRGCEEEDETMEHILCDCPALSSIRKSILGDYWLTTASVRDLPLSDVLNYCKAVGWVTP